MRKALVVGIAVVLVAQAANAVVVTYSIKPQDPVVIEMFEGAANAFGVYASISNDCGGMITYDVTLNSSAFSELYNYAPFLTGRKTTPTTTYRYLGFADLRSGENEARLTGSQKATGGTTYVPVYGMGQTAGDLTTLIPTGYSAFDGMQETYGAPMLIAIGIASGAALTSFEVADWFNMSVASRNDSVYYTTNGSPTIDPNKPTVVLSVVPEPATAGLLALGAVGLLFRRRRG